MVCVHLREHPHRSYGCTNRIAGTTIIMKANAMYQDHGTKAGDCAIMKNGRVHRYASNEHFNIAKIACDYSRCPSNCIDLSCRPIYKGSSILEHKCFELAADKLDINLLFYPNGASKQLPLHVGVARMNLNGKP